MNNLKFVFLFFAIGFSLHGFSQLNDFDLTKYKLPDLDIRTLETNFNITGSNAYSKAPSQTISGSEEYGYNQYNGRVYVNYNHYLNNVEYQRESNLRVDFSSYFYNTKEDEKLIFKNSGITPSLSYQINNRKYFHDLWFFETDLDLNYQYGKSKRFSTDSSGSSESNDNSQSNDFLGYVPLRFGIGRIEQVQDARQAIYIFEELSKIERVSSNITDEQIIEFARLISQLKKKRFFDSRLRRMAEIESLDSFLISNNFVSKQDARYFTTLGDFWDNGNNPIRNSGTRFSGAILPGFHYYDFNNTGDEKYYHTQSVFMLNGGFELKHEKPINLLWQNSIDLSCHAGIVDGRNNDKTNSVEYKFRIPNINLGFYHTIGFYPNTRTNMSFGYSVQYMQLFDITDIQNEISGVEGKGVKAATNLSINYYISPKFRLNASSSFYYIWRDSNDNTNINFDNSIGNNFLLGNLANGTYLHSSALKSKDLFNRFRISLIYSIF